MKTSQWVVLGLVATLTVMLMNAYVTPRLPQTNSSRF
jgi:hypothetical protein